MFSIDLLLFIFLMSLLFLRHTAVYKDPNKINYTPVVFALGILGTITHLLLSTTLDGTLFKESLLSLGVGVLLFAVMSVMTQTASLISSHDERLRIFEMGDNLDTLSGSISSVKERLDILTQMESTTHEQLRSVFREELDALHVIQSNQKLFVSKIEALLAQQQNAMERFEEFALSEMPSLDNVVHRHIDLLRVAEQDHFNQLKNIVRLSGDEQKEIHTQLSELREFILKTTIHQSPDHTVAILQKELDRIIHDFSRHLNNLGIKTESMVLAIQENDALLKGSREQSELIMQQMVLSTKQMKEISSQSKELSDSLKPLSRLFVSAETLHDEFMHARGKLSELILTLESYERQEYRAIRQTLEEVATQATAQMELLIQKMQKHETLPMIETKSVQELASKVKLQKSYMGENQE